MQERIEFRILEKDAKEYLSPEIGIPIGDGHVRKVVVDTTDPLFARIGELQREFRKRGDSFFLGRTYYRRYSREEFEHAALFHLSVARFFEPAGEECGTVYDDSKACPRCGAGAPQVSPLVLPSSRIPRSPDFAETIAGEIVVSARVVKLFREHGIRGASFEAVRDKKGTESQEHYQLSVVGCTAEVDPATRFGSHPFDDTSYGKCPQCDLAGLNLLSEVRLRQGTLPDCDIIQTRQMVGVRRGLLRPRPILLVSPRTWKAITEAKLKGLIIEVAYVV